MGETLTADTDDIQDTDGIVTSTLIYQWFANDGTENTANESATSSTYTLVTDDEGKTNTVQVGFSDEFGYTEALTSEPTATVASRQTSSQRSQQQNSPAPTIKGSPALSEAGSDDEWTPDETVQVTLTFSEEVNVDTTDGTPSIGIQLSGTLDHNAPYASGSGTTKLVFSYTLTDDDGKHSSMFVPGDSLTLNGGTITSASSGGDAALGHNGAASGFIRSACHTQQPRDRSAHDQRDGAGRTDADRINIRHIRQRLAWPTRSSPTSGSLTMGPKTRISKTRPFLPTL